MTLEQQIEAVLQDAEFQKLHDDMVMDKFNARLLQIDVQARDRVREIIGHWHLRRQNVAQELIEFSDEIRGRLVSEDEPLPRIASGGAVEDDLDPLKLGIYDHVEAAE